MHWLSMVYSTAALALVATPFALAAPLDAAAGGIPITVPLKAHPNRPQVQETKVETTVVGKLKDGMHSLQPIGSSWADDYGPLRTRPFPVWRINSDEDWKGFGFDELVRQRSTLKNVLKSFGAWDDETKGPVEAWRPKKSFLDKAVDGVLGWFRDDGDRHDGQKLSRRDSDTGAELEDLMRLYLTAWSELLDLPECARLGYSISQGPKLNPLLDVVLDPSGCLDQGTVGQEPKPEGDVVAADGKAVSLLGVARRDLVVPVPVDDHDSDDEDDGVFCPNPFRDPALPKCACVSWTKPKKWDIFGWFHQRQRIVDWSQCESYFKKKLDKSKQQYLIGTEVYDPNGEAVLPDWVQKDDARLPECAQVKTVKTGRRSDLSKPQKSKRKLVVDLTDCYGLLSKTGPENKVIHYGERPQYLPNCARLKPIWIKGMGPEADYSRCHGTGVSNFTDQIRVHDEGNGVFIPFSSSLDYLPKCARLSFSAFESRPGYFADYAGCEGPPAERYQIKPRGDDDGEATANDIALAEDGDVPVVIPGEGPVPHDQLRRRAIIIEVRRCLVESGLLAEKDRYGFQARHSEEDMKLLRQYLSDEDIIVLPSAPLADFLEVIIFEPEEIDSFTEEELQRDLEDWREGVTDRESLRKYRLEYPPRQAEMLRQRAKKNRLALWSLSRWLELAEKLESQLRKALQAANNTTGTSQLTRRVDIETKYGDPDYKEPGPIKAWWDKFWSHGEHKFCFLWMCKTVGSSPPEMDPESQFNGYWSHSGSSTISLKAAKTFDVLQDDYSR